MRRQVIMVAADAGTRESLARELRAHGIEAVSAADGAAARSLALAGPRPRLVLLDLALDGLEGFEPVAAFRLAAPPRRLAVLAAEAGTPGPRPLRPAAPAELARFLAELGGDSGETRGEGFAGLVAASPAMQEALRAARRAAASRIPVLLLGESGTGKERVARAIHAASPRAAGPFVAVNCGALPEALVESLLFGHERGAFTGADRAQEGRFRAAEGGTVFLDEVGDLPAPAQVKLLRVLQEGEVDPVGARRPVRVDVRVIAATNRDLAARVAAGRFREDLFFRLAGLEIRLPPLRARREDIAALARAHAAAVAALEGRDFAGFGAGVEDWLAAQPWPGNVRELQNAVHRAMVLSEAPVLPLAAFAPPGPPAPPAPAGAAAPAGSPAPRRVRPLAEIEAEAIADALLLCGGRISEAARRLGIGRSTLYRKMQEYGIAPGGVRGRDPP